MTHLDCGYGLDSSINLLNVSYFYPILSFRPSPQIYLQESLLLLLWSLSPLTLQPSPTVLPSRLSHPKSSNVELQSQYG
jgi:hypothetical protein